MKFVEIKEEEYLEFFKWILEKEEVKLSKELDILLASSYDEPYIYYTEQIEEFFNTTPMQRIGQINQLGTSINLNDNAYHTRLDHCKGSYKNALDFWVLKCKDSKYREKIDNSVNKSHKKNLILADIMEMARHDDCHTMLSHALEGLICNGKADHEDIGKRILLENKEYRVALDSIRDGLYQTMCDNAINDNTAFKLLREGNTDFDRMDYIMRDLLYLGLPYSRELIENLIRNCNIKEIEINGESQEVPVYTVEGLRYVEKFLETRKIGYEMEYSSKERKVLDSAVKYLCIEVAKNDTIESKFIRNAVKNYMQENIEDINLESFLQTNDIRLYTEILDIAMHSQNENLKELAILSLPSTTALLQLGVEMLNTKQRGKDLDKYSSYELDYIKRLKELREPNNTVRERIENINKRKLFTATNYDSEEKLYETEQRIKQILGIEEVSESGIIIWNKRLRTYKEDEPIYAEAVDGKIYTLDEHPNLSIDISSENLMGIAIIPSVLKLSGYDDNTIEKLQEVIRENSTKKENIKYPEAKNRMSKYQTGKTPYLIGFEEK